MKKVVLILLFSISFFCSFGQIALYDAQYLCKINTADLNAIKKAETEIGLSNYEKDIVNNYTRFLEYPFSDNIKNLDINTLKGIVKKYDAFLENQYQNAVIASIDKNNKALPFLPLISTIAGGGLSLDADQQTKIIDGITKYYAEEFQKAQLLTYLQTFKNTIGEIGEMQVLFPQTYTKLQSADPSKFPDLGNEYKSIFNDDLYKIPEHLIAHIENHTAKNNAALEMHLKWLKAENLSKIKENDYYECFKINADIGQKLINNYHPVDLYNFLDKSYQYSPSLLQSHSKTSEKIKIALHGLNLIQMNLLDTIKRETSPKNLWINLYNLPALEKKLEWVYFAGLLYQKDREFFNYFFWEAQDLPPDAIVDTHIEDMQKKITNILSVLGEMQDFRANLNTENLRENFPTYMGLVIKTVLAVGNSTENGDAPSRNLMRFSQVAGHTMNLYDNARKKDYSNSFYYTLEIINSLIADDKNDYMEITNKIDNYSSFMAEAINTKNSDEIKECIKKYVAPPASFIQKRELLWTLSITGQPGYFVGAEKLKKYKNRAFSSGITLPMGFELTFKAKRNQNSASWGIFAQLVDLGAVLNFRLDNQTSTLPDKITFKQIFSPGGMLTYGVTNSPLTLGLGYQYTSELRKVTNNGNESFPHGERILFRVSWDIPFINIIKSKAR